MVYTGGTKPASAGLLLLAITVTVALASCGQSGQQKPARLRLGNFLWETDQVKIALYRDSEQQKNATLSYGKLSDYQALKPGRYRMRVAAGDHDILEKTFGLGSGEAYTLIIAGIASGAPELNKETLNKKLHTFVEGSIARTSNGYLPQMLLINDFFVEEKETGQFRIINLMPGTTCLHGKLMNESKNELSSTLEYFHGSPSQPVSTGDLELELSFSGSPLKFSEQTVTIRERALNSFFIIPRKGHYLTSPVVVRGVTENSP
ncbi:DUF4397 domain-containing protein [Microbulbifer hainanensis]|uniref:DUF4397 domain-containing protein n=1 Tax=Microbulbifer hainanensis TaxID=2735675 RepID=UPI00186769D5|nr:DUF4397 domain-containing protein [Microbulbifer hainanensis]